MSCAWLRMLVHKNTHICRCFVNSLRITPLHHYFRGDSFFPCPFPHFPSKKQTLHSSFIFVCLFASMFLHRHRHIQLCILYAWLGVCNFQNILHRANENSHMKCLKYFAISDFHFSCHHQTRYDIFGSQLSAMSTVFDVNFLNMKRKNKKNEFDANIITEENFNRRKRSTRMHGIAIFHSRFQAVCNDG